MSHVTACDNIVMSGEYLIYHEIDVILHLFQCLVLHVIYMYNNVLSIQIPNLLDVYIGLILSMNTLLTCRSPGKVFIVTMMIISVCNYVLCG